MAKPTRTIQDINNEYFRKAAELGDLQHRLNKIPAQMESVQRDLKRIDNEADEVRAYDLKKQQEKAKEDASKAKIKTDAHQNGIAVEVSKEGVQA